MTFAGRVWRLLVGIKDALALAFLLLFFALLYSLLSVRPSAGEVREGALVLELDGTIVEEAAEIDPVQALLSNSAPVGEYQARDIVRALDTAARDERIKVVVLDLDRFLGGGQVHIQAIGEALDRVRAAKKPVLAFATGYWDDSMLLAAHASEVWVDPMGGAVIAGPGGNTLYYKGLIDRLKVNVHVFKVGTYKSAVEPYLLDGMSDPARENAAALYATLWEEYRANLLKARPQAKVALVTGDPAGWIAAARGNLALAAKQAGLVDRIGPRDAFERRLVQLVGKDAWSDLPRAYPATALDAWLEDNPAPQQGAAIGVVTVAGDIMDGDLGPGTAGGQRIADLLDDALDDGLAGLVVRVDSPGGSTFASEQIRNAVLRHREAGIPVAISMGNVAASGGYWVATAGNRIFAEPETITGSIGIFSVLPTFEATAAAVGVTSDGVKTGPLSGQPDVIGGLTPEAEAILQSAIEHGYAVFLGHVAKARGMTPARVDALAQGRVWDGGSARQLGLVDQYGGEQDALEWVAAKAGLKRDGWHAAYLGEEPSRTDTLLRHWLIGEEARGGPVARDAGAMIALSRDRALRRIDRDLARLLTMRGAQAYCLACPPSAAQTYAPAMGNAGNDPTGGLGAAGWLRALVRWIAAS